MSDHYLLSSVEQGLRQARAARGRVVSRMAELQYELGALRTELEEFDRIIADGEGALLRIVNTIVNNRHDSDGQLGGVTGDAPALRFEKSTIAEASETVLAEAGTPLHVTDIFRRLLAGGLQLRGHNPTVSITCALNRDEKFRRVAPATYGLALRPVSRSA